MIRLYNQYEPDYRTSKDVISREKIEDQKYYAEKYLKSISNVERRNGGDSDSSIKSKDAFRYACNKFPQFLLRVATAVLFIYGFSYILNQA